MGKPMDFRPAWSETTPLPRCSGDGCRQGRKACPTPVACRIVNEPADDGLNAGIFLWPLGLSLAAVVALFLMVVAFA